MAEDPLEVHVSKFLGISGMDELREDFNRFADEMKSLRGSIQALSLSTDAATKAQKDLSDFYSGTGRSDNASTAPNAPGRPQPTTSDEPRSGQASDGASDPTGDPSPPQQKGFLRALGSAARTVRSDGLMGAAENFYSMRPIPVSSSHGPVHPGAGGSSGASRPPGAAGADLPWERFMPGEEPEPLRMPQFGEFTAQNVLEAAGNGLRHRYDASGRPMTGLASRTLLGMASFAPKVAMFHQFAAEYGYDLRSHTREGTGGLEGLGEAYGVSGSGSDINGPLGFGFRLPFLNAASREGIHRTLKKAFESRESGINMEQLNFMEQQQLARGWQGNSAMHNGMKEIMKYNKGLGESEGVWDLADKATRYGTTTMNDFVKTMKLVPDAAHAAHVSMDQIVKDADALGELNQQQGGTHAQGQQNAIVMAALTGMDPGALGQALNNGFVQSYAFRQTGLPPWMQGLQTAGQRTQTLTGAVNEMYKRMGAVHGPGTRKVGDSYIDVDPRDAKIASLKMLFPELSPEQLKTLTNPKEAKRIQTGADLDTQMADWSHDVHTLLRRAQGGKPVDPRIHTLLNQKDQVGGHVVSWGHMEHQMRDARDANGRRMLTDKEIEEIRKAGGKAGHDVKGHWVNHQPTGRGSGVMREWVPGKHFEGKTPADQTDARLKKFREIMADKNKHDMAGPKITIELGKAASKVMHLESEMKKGNAAEVPLNRYAGGNNTATPMPNLP